MIKTNQQKNITEKTLC